jgi:CHASE2 domain-containing sensor protein
VSVLYGESGVGKSSLLRASVLSHLRTESRRNLEASGKPEVVAVAFADWSLEDPLSALKTAIRRAVALFSPELAVDAPDGTLAEVLADWCERVGGAVFVVLDQLEELFLYHGADEIGRALEQELMAAIRRREAAANFLLSIREDALAKLDRLQGRIPGLLDNLLRLEHLDERGAREAIERPLDRWNRVEPDQIAIEPALVDAVVVQVEAGKLLATRSGGAGRVQGGGREARIEAPYLQLVLSRIWEEERATASGILRLETLERLGGAERIVRTHLDEVLARFSRGDRKAAAEAFRYLVTPSGSKIAHRPQDLAEYAGVPADRLARVLGVLAGEARILRPVGDGAYEIYHDVLAEAVLDWRRRFEESQAHGLLARGVLLSMASGVVVIMVVAYLGSVLGGWEARAADQLFLIRGAATPDDVLIVGIDNRTFADLDRQWPFPRRLHARVIDRLKRDGAKAIAFDIQFSEPTDAADDNALIEAISQARNVVLATTELDEQGHAHVLGGEGATRAAHARVGHSYLPASSDGVVRRVPWGTAATGSQKISLESFGLVTAEVATNRRIRPANLGGRSAVIDYAGPPRSVGTFSFSTVLRGRFRPGTFHGKIVVVGATAPSLQDLHATPAGGGLMSGPELQANVVETALRGFPLRSRREVDVPLIVLLGLLVPLASLRFGRIATLGVALAAGALYLVTLQTSFDHDVLLPAVYPLLSLALTTALVLGLRARRRAS